MKSYYELLLEVLNQRSIIDNRNITSIENISESVLIAFNQACEYMRDLHNWKWNIRDSYFINTDGQDSYPMPYGIVQSLTYVRDDESKYILNYVPDLTATEGIPCQWSQDWANEEIIISPAVDFSLDSESQMIIKYMDKNIAYNGTRTELNLIPRFNPLGNVATQYLNVPEAIYDSYSRCVVLKTRIFLNEGAQGTVFDAQQKEFIEAYNGLLSFAKTPFYTSETTEI